MAQQDGNIPAPDLFNDQITCSMNVPGMNPMPTVTPMGAMTSPLTDAIGMGMSTIDITATDGIFVDLGFVVPPGGGNCGKGMGDGAPFDAENNPTGTFTTMNQGAIATDVAEGYSAVLGEYMNVYGDPGMADSTGLKGALDTAKRARAMAADDASDSVIESLDEAVDEAQKAYDEALARFNAIAQGPIYQAGVAEWMAKADVTKAVVDYNAAVEKAYGDDGTGGSYNTFNTMENDRYIPLGGGELFTTSGTGAAVTITNGMAEVNHAFLAEYANQDGTNAASVAENGVTTVSATGSNFDAAGRLVVPMAVDTGDVDEDGATDDIVPVYAASSNTVADIRTARDNARLAADALKKARDENTNPLRQAVLDEAYRRAQIEADHYNGQWTKTLADSRNQNDVTTDDPDTSADEAAPYSIASRHAAYIKDSNARATAEADLRSKAAAREAATAAVVSHFTSPASFYDQLVARRIALKAAADKVVADAANPSQSQTDAAEAAAKALAAAESAQSAYQALIDPDDSNDPVAGLVDELLKTDGDDGQALVDAIGSTYDTAKEAHDRANEVADDVAGLTGDDGAVSRNTAEIGMDGDGNSRIDHNEARSEQNEKDIEELDGRVAMNEGEIWDDDGNSRIDANETRSMTNATNIATNAGSIKTNADNIANNAANIMTNTMEIGYGDDGMSRIDHNEARSTQNAADIMTNAGNIATNSTMIGENTAAIGMNTSAISALDGRVGSNASAINRNEMRIGELNEALEVVRAGVAASMALAGMPAINGRGISIGVGSYDGESAFAVGFQIQSDMASFKVGVTSSGGETGASAGVGFQF